MRQMGITRFSYATDATLNVGTYQVVNGSKALGFQCNRHVAAKDPRIVQIYRDALHSRAMTTVPPFCQNDNQFRECGNTRGYLTECRCPLLNRTTHYKAHRTYENKVIDSVIDLVNKGRLTHIKLACFGSGRLLGEEILLFRLFEALQQNKFKGTIELFFIDSDYQAVINQSVPKINLERSVGGARYIQQFLQEASMCLPKSITLKGLFFGHSEDYLSAVRSNQEYKHHLLIGSDVMDAYKIMGPIGKEAGLNPQREPIALVHARQTPEVCLIDPKGKLKDCKDVSESNLTVPVALTITAGVLFTAAIIGAICVSSRGKGYGTHAARV
jgi:hypothetical protein